MYGFPVARSMSEHCPDVRPPAMHDVGLNVVQPLDDGFKAVFRGRPASHKIHPSRHPGIRIVEAAYLERDAVIPGDSHLTVAEASPHERGDHAALAMAVGERQKKRRWVVADRLRVPGRTARRDVQCLPIHEGARGESVSIMREVRGRDHGQPLEVSGGAKVPRIETLGIHRLPIPWNCFVRVSDNRTDTPVLDRDNFVERAKRQSRFVPHVPCGECVPVQAAKQ